MNIKTSLLEGYINFVNSTKKQNTCLTRLLFLFVVIISLFLIFLLLKYLNEEHLFATRKTQR